MNKSNVLALIDTEIERLQRARQILSGSNGLGGGRALSQLGRKRRRMSAEAKRRISLAQKKRWAARKRARQ